MSKAIEIRVTGKVQGVGFRPFVFALAQRYHLQGEVFNDSAGVGIHLLPSPRLEAFLLALRRELPPLAKIDTLSQREILWAGQQPSDFTIAPSQAGLSATDILPDIALCQKCLAEMNDPQDRRYRYPFITCTHCGPRFSIIKKMPYDRPYTSMESFPLCAECAKEYSDPLDRRFHAQPLACPRCGPEIFMPMGGTLPPLKGEAALQAAIKGLKEGKIVAIKALGGFHLACLATSEAAVLRLRERKNRPAKPFAVMIPPEGGWLEKICVPTADLKTIRALLASPAAPIVLAPHSSASPLSGAVAPLLSEIGLMFPSHPLAHLLAQDISQPLVMTSGNRNHFAPALSNEEALEHLGTIADLFLLHNRDIVERADDSVLRPLSGEGEAEILRRGRGFAPDALKLPDGFPQNRTLLALGGDLKNSFCLLHEGKIFTGAHYGDLAAGNVFPQWEKMLEKFPRLYHAAPEEIACDAHPSYLSHQWAKAQNNIHVKKIYHHHAHIAACLGENGWKPKDGAVIGLCLDGLGYGKDGALWGGECFLADYQKCERLGGLPAVALPGGDLAAKQPWRNLLAQLESFVPDWESSKAASCFAGTPYLLVGKALRAGVNAPLASSCGRLFEAVSAALNIAPLAQSYEGEAACRLEALARTAGPCPHPLILSFEGTTLNLAGFWQSFLGWESTKAQKAWAFHDVLAQGFAEMALFFARKYQINAAALSGGCLHNRLLRERLIHHLAPLNVLTHRHVPAGDGGIALGQALIALAQGGLPAADRA